MYIFNVQFVLQQSESVTAAPNNKVTIITAIAKKSAVEQVPVSKGELMESNVDAMEVCH